MKLLSLLFTTAALAYQVEIHPEYQQGLAINDVPAERRLHWMRVANEAVYADGHPCPQAPFGTAIVNTTSDELVCVISNKVGVTGSKFLFFSSSGSSGMYPSQNVLCAVADHST